MIDRNKKYYEARSEKEVVEEKERQRKNIEYGNEFLKKVQNCPNRVSIPKGYYCSEKKKLCRTVLDNDKCPEFEKNTN